MTEIARFTPEQTARFFSGGDIGRPQYTDPETQRKQDALAAQLRNALAISVSAFVTALEQSESPTTAIRLRELFEASHTDGRARDLFAAMYAELLTQALRP